MSSSEQDVLRIGTYYCCAKAVGTGSAVCGDCNAFTLQYQAPDEEPNE